MRCRWEKYTSVGTISKKNREHELSGTISLLLRMKTEKKNYYPKDGILYKSFQYLNLESVKQEEFSHETFSRFFQYPFRSPLNCRFRIFYNDIRHDFIAVYLA